MALILASFPNSRIKPRPATSARDTKILEVPNGVSEVLDVNLNRTDVLIKNLDSTKSLWYGYDANIDNLVGEDGAVEILPLDTVSIDVRTKIFIFNADALAINIAIDEGEG